MIKCDNAVLHWTAQDRHISYYCQSVTWGLDWRLPRTLFCYYLVQVPVKAKFLNKKNGLNVIPRRRIDTVALTSCLPDDVSAPTVSLLPHSIYLHTSFAHFRGHHNAVRLYLTACSYELCKVSDIKVFKGLQFFFSVRIEPYIDVIFFLEPSFDAFSFTRISLLLLFVTWDDVRLPSWRESHK